jgi:hypothetical protein
VIRFERPDGEAEWITPEDVRGIRPGFTEGCTFIVFDAARGVGTTVRGSGDEVAAAIAKEKRTPTESSSP